MSFMEKRPARERLNLLIPGLQFLAKEHSSHSRLLQGSWLPLGTSPSRGWGLPVSSVSKRPRRRGYAEAVMVWAHSETHGDLQKASLRARGEESQVAAGWE